MCDASTEKSQQCFLEQDFKILTKNDYDEFINQGIFKKSALNESSYYNIIENYGFDLTHDLWLGVVPLELSLVLTTFINQNFFDIELLNSRIKLFSYGSTDIKNKPNLLYIQEKVVKCKQKAAKTCCLFKLLPFIIGNVFIYIFYSKKH